MVQQTTEDVVDRFSLKEKVLRIVTDNASTVIKAYRFGLSVDEGIHLSNNQAQLIPGGSPTFDVDEGK